MNHSGTRDPNELTGAHVALHLVINELSEAILPVALHRSNTLVNEVSPSLLVRTNLDKLTAVLSNLLETVISNSQDSLIRFSAKIYDDVLLLHIKKNCRQFNDEFVNCLGPVQRLAEELYGSVCITSHRNDVTTVALSFINQPLAA